MQATTSYCLLGGNGQARTYFPGIVHIWLLPTSNNHARLGLDAIKALSTEQRKACSSQDTSSTEEVAGIEAVDGGAEAIRPKDQVR